MVVEESGLESVREDNFLDILFLRLNRSIN